MQAYAGADWLVGDLQIKQTPSPLGRAVADLLGSVFRGIYHMNYTSLRKVEWDNPRYIDVTVDREVATFDSDELTALVVLCHDKQLRCSVAGLAPGYVRLTFHQRLDREGNVGQRHPTMEQAVERVRRERA